LSAKEVVLQSCTNCGMGEVSFAVQLLFVGAVEDGVRDITHSKNPKPKSSQSRP